jgi:16S rRNA (adenine1518-N6/adenine1519-N6)-dimethyltransferase
VGRRLGQHFLSRKSILENIAAAACGDRVPLAIEIGPGKGPLTECLLERAEKVIAIEVDTYLVHYLRQKFHDALESGRLVLIEGDVLKTDLAQWGPGVVTGNLPYYITSPILEKLFAMGDAWTRGVFLVQAEVADRLAAQPGTRDFGFLSVQTQLYSRPAILFPVSRTAFRPPPKVDSAVVLLEPRDAAADFGIEDRALFLRFASVCFRHKRKTLRNNLTEVYGRERVDALEEIGKRAEQLGVRELAELYRKLLQPPPH